MNTTKVTNKWNHCWMCNTAAEHATKSTIDEVFDRAIFTAVFNYKSFRNGNE